MVNLCGSIPPQGEEQGAPPPPPGGGAQWANTLALSLLVLGLALGWGLSIILVAVGKHQYDGIVTQTKKLSLDYLALSNPGALCVNGEFNSVGSACTPLSWGCPNASYIEEIDFNNNPAVSARRLLMAIADCKGLPAVYFSNCDSCSSWGINYTTTRRLGGITWELVPDTSTGLVGGENVFSLTKYLEYNFQQNLVYTQVAYPTAPFDPPAPGVQGQPPPYNTFTWRLNTGDGAHLVWYEINLDPATGWQCVASKYSIDQQQSTYCFNDAWYMTAPYCSLYTCTEGVDSSQISTYSAQVGVIQTIGASNVVNSYVTADGNGTSTPQYSVLTRSNADYCILFVCADYNSATAVYTGILATAFAAGVTFVGALASLVVAVIFKF